MPEPLLEPLEFCLPLGLQGEEHVRPRDARAMGVAVVHHLQDVGAAFFDDAGDEMERPWPIGDGNADPHLPLRLHQAAVDDPLQEVHVDVPAADDQHDFLALEGLGIFLIESVERRQWDRARAFGDDARLFHQPQHREGDRFIRNRDRFIHHVLEQVEHLGMRDLHADPIREGDGLIDLRELALVEGVDHGAGPAGLPGHELHLGPKFLEHAAHASDEPSSADGAEDVVDVRQLLQQLEADGALAGDHARVFVGVDEDHGSLLHQLFGVLEAVFDRLAMQDHGGTERLGVLNLRQRRAFGHDDGRLHAELPSGPGHTLRVVPRAHRQDTELALRGLEVVDHVGRSSHLERAHGEHVFQLQEHLAPVLPGEPFVLDQRSRRNDLREYVVGRAVVFESDFHLSILSKQCFDAEENEDQCPSRL